MALWKPFRGKRADLDNVEKHDGYVYFTTDDASLFFDYVDNEGNLQRKQINKDEFDAIQAQLEDVATKEWVDSHPIGQGIKNIPWSSDLVTNQVDLSGAKIKFDTNADISTPNSMIDSSGGYTFTVKGDYMYIAVQGPSSTDKIYNSGWNKDEIELPPDFGYFTALTERNITDLNIIAPTGFEKTTDVNTKEYIDYKVDSIAGQVVPNNGEATTAELSTLKVGDTNYALPRGENGTTYTPSVSSDGTLSWTNNGGLSNPTAVNIKGQKGEPGIQGEKGATGAQGPDGYTPLKGVDYYTEADKSEWSEYIASELAKRGQLKPEFANDISECEDESKLYVLPDGYIYANIKTATEGVSKPNFTNVMDDPNAYIKEGYRYSSSSAAFKSQASDCAIVIPITKGQHVIRVRGAGDNATYKDSFYFGDNNQTFSYLPATGNITRTVSSNGDIVINTNYTAATISYCVFHVQSGINASELIVTVDQEITYTTTAGGTSYQWTNTGHAFVPADYENRIIAVENKSEENAEKISELESELEDQMNKPTGTIIMYISPNGNDSNDGLTASTPKKTVKACIDAGASKISAQRGTYNEKINLSNIDTMEIFPTDNDYTFDASIKRYPPIVFDTSHTIPVSSLSAYNSIKKVAYAETNEALNYVFKNSLYNTVYSTTHGYHAVLWAITGNIKNDFKLKPMATIAEVETTTNSFTWVNNVLYLNANFTDVTEIRVPTIYDNAVTVFTANKVKLTDVEVRFAGRYSILIENCPDVEMDNCSVKYTSNGSGFDFKNVNGTLRNCYASRVHDGYGIGDYGHTIFIDCVAEWCYDDGMSHHRGCTGTVIGGRYEGNVKAGNCPAHGAHVNIYGGLYKDNGLWGIAYWYENTYNPCTGMVHGAVMVGNSKGLVVDAGSTVTALNCHYKDNGVDKEITGTLIEVDDTNQSVSGGTIDQQSIEFVDSADECVDTNKLYILPDGSVYAYINTTADITTPNFTNLMDDPNAYIKEKSRYSHSSQAWQDHTSVDSIVIPFKHSGGTSTIRIRGAVDDTIYDYMYFGDSNSTFTTAFGSGTSTTDSNGDIVYTINYSSALNGYVTFTVASGVNANSLIVTMNEEITYTVIKDVTGYQWANTGYSFITKEYTEELEKRLNSTISNSGGTTVFSTPAYAPIPQLPANGTADFHGLDVTTEKAYTYMNALANKYKGYVTKELMGRDQSNNYDHNRYVLCKAYYRAWLKPNYPMMFAWKHGSDVIYSVSASPRCPDIKAGRNNGDTMYSTPYIGTVYGEVTSVNPSTPNAASGIPGTPSTRTVNGLVFERYKAGDIEPTIVYTKVESSISALNSGTVYDSAFNSLTKVTEYTKEAITCANGIVYTRYPFEDRKADKSKPLSIFILANEHGHYGDNKVPSIALMRMAKDLCENRENPFLQWLKENAMITMIPVGNPWGYDPSAGTNGAGYNNSRGVNINRNYDTPGWAGSDNNYGDDTTFGTYPGSENETQHIMNTMHLCKAKVGLSMHGLGLGQFKSSPTEYTEGLMWQGCGYDKSRMTKVAEVLFSDYGQLIGGHTSGDQSYEYCGKSPAYIQYVGAVGGLNEIPDYETGTLDLYTPTVMEAAYTQMLLFLQTWCEEALEKLS